MTEAADGERIMRLECQLDALRELGEVKIRALEEQIAIHIAASEKAIAKAEAATEKRFEGVNEFRAQLAAQASTFTQREVSDAQFAELRRAVSDLTEKVGKLV